MTKEELKQKCTERAKIFQQAMESCHSNNPMDCIEWFADRIIDLEAENEQIKNSDTLCKLIGEQKRKITELEAQINRAFDILAFKRKRIAELEAQIEKMKNCGNCKNFSPTYGLCCYSLGDEDYDCRLRKWEIKEK